MRPEARSRVQREASGLDREDRQEAEGAAKGASELEGRVEQTSGATRRTGSVIAPSKERGRARNWIQAAPLVWSEE